MVAIAPLYSHSFLRSDRTIESTTLLLEEYKAFFRQWNSGVAEQECVILAIAAEGEHIAVRYSIAGRHAGDLFGIPPLPATPLTSQA